MNYMQATFDSEEFDPQWYALRVVPQREYEIAEMLRKQGLATFIPTEIRTHKRSSYAKGKVEFAVPILPGCIFVGFPSAPAWYFLRRNHLIMGAVSLASGGQPTRLDFLKLLEFFSGVKDGCMVRDNGLRLIHIPGRLPVRPLVTRARTISPRKRDGGERTRARREAKHLDVPQFKHTDFLSRFVYGGTA